MLCRYQKHILCVRGNCDAEVDQMVLNFPIMADYAILDLGDKRVYATHGHLYHESHRPPMTPGDILLHGHTHVPICHVYDDFICMNPGSVSIPKENSYHGYMTLCDRQFLWKDLDGQVEDQYQF